jgi:predicted dinucleotide-binding enzyme
LCSPKENVVRIAVIGTGNVGGTLGRAFARAGLHVVFGSRDPGGSTVAGDTTAKVTTVADAVTGADVVVLAQPGDQVGDFLRTHAAALDGTLVVDATNRFPGPVLHGAAEVAELAPGARYARAFSTQAWETFEAPTWNGVPGDLFFAAPDADRSTVEQLINAVGLRPQYVGAGEQTMLDPLLFVLFSAFEQHGRHVGVRLLTDN